VLVSFTGQVSDGSNNEVFSKNYSIALTNKSISSDFVFKRFSDFVAFKAALEIIIKKYEEKGYVVFRDPQETLMIDDNGVVVERSITLIATKFDNSNK